MTGENFIGNTRSAQGKVGFKTFDPVANKVDASDFFEATAAEIDTAVALAMQAQSVAA